MVVEDKSPSSKAEEDEPIAGPEIYFRFLPSEKSCIAARDYDYF